MELLLNLKPVENIAYHEPVDLENNPFGGPLPDSSNYILKSVKGIIHVCDSNGELLPDLKEHCTSLEEFMLDFQFLQDLMIDGPLKSYCYRRLSYLLHKYQLHVLLNEVRELAEQKVVPHRDFYNVRKVDTHVHAASCMNHKHLLRFMKKKMKTDAATVVYIEKGVPMTLEQAVAQHQSRVPNFKIRPHCSCAQGYKKGFYTL
uniref:Uncharacterized protein n=1 Tax=Romanomermis culicivorax TaxID=13658 RepID=A0A915IQY5_ROMCU